MLTYALEEGLELDPVVATLISGQDLSSTEQPVGDTGAQSLSSLMELHKSLAKAVAPATPCSLEATAPVSGYLGFLRRPPLIGWMVLAAVICALGFVLTLPAPTPPKADDPSTSRKAAVIEDFEPRHAMVILAAANPTNDRAPSPFALASKQWNWLFGAGLGAAFYTLFTAHEYVRKRTFDPRYNSVYLIRFVLGVIAGLILANLGSIFDQNDTFSAWGQV